jgi:hypothetical protein
MTKVDLYDRINREWKGLQLRKDLPGHPPINDKNRPVFMSVMILTALEILFLIAVSGCI